MARFITEARNRGAKLVLVGDAEQLQPIEAGAPFRAITERSGAARLREVHRQKEVWQQKTSQHLAKAETGKALQAYDENDRIVLLPGCDEAIATLVEDYVADICINSANATRLTLAHRRADVKALNEHIRDRRKELGELVEDISCSTTHGKRPFSTSDCLVFTRNDRDLDIKNGMPGTVTKISKTRITVRLDDPAPDGDPRKQPFTTVAKHLSG